MQFSEMDRAICFFKNRIELKASGRKADTNVISNKEYRK
jgi:hypothetical protein